MKEIWREYWAEYRGSGRAGKGAVLDEVCRKTGYHRKYVISVLNGPLRDGDEERPKRRRKSRYKPGTVGVLHAVWEASGYPWSVRLKAMLPLWLPWVRAHGLFLSPEAEKALLGMSARQMDRYLAPKRRAAKKRLYGRTKPGTLLRHQIPVRTSHWDADKPGYLEGDTVSHSGPSASGEWVHSLNVTDILSCWVETRAVKGNSEAGVSEALEEIRHALPFKALELDTDNGSEFINWQVVRYCEKHKIAFTRSRPYKKDDNAHVEQKNWTHVRKVFGWQRYDTSAQQEAMNALYRNELRLMMNLFQPCVKLVEKHHVGTKVIRRYDAPQAPLDRLVAYYGEDHLPPKVALFAALRKRIDPMELGKRIDQALEALNRPAAAPPARRMANAAQRAEGSPRAALCATSKDNDHASLLR